MEQGRKESKLVVKKVEEERASSEKQNVSVQKTLNQIRQEMEQDRKERLKQQAGVRQESEASVCEAAERLAREKEIAAGIHSSIENLVKQVEKNRLEVSAQMDLVKGGVEGRIVEMAQYASEVQDSVVAVSSHPIFRLFSWHATLSRIRKIKKPSWLQSSSTHPALSDRSSFWRGLERSIRNKRKRWIAGIGFDRDWYLREYPDVGRAGIDPLDHYIQHGIQESRWKSGRHTESKKKLLQKTIPWSFDRISFDSSWYLNRYPDVAAANIDAFWHYKNQGIAEGRFKNKKMEEKASLLKSGIEQNNGITRDLESQNKSSAEVLAISNSLHGSGPVQTDIRAIALYLPQYHATPENDKWWGKGFTEWTNVRRGKPHYEGHYQPHIPHADLGYYDLNDPSVMEKQAAMAKEAGIEGFCLYYYWFNGKRLLNMPADRMLASGKPDFPFCFCWANENLTRTWDGGDNEILMAQKYSVENDEGLIWDLLPAFRDHRYIRVAGKPLLVVYRPGLLPNVRETTDRWREICRTEGIGEIHLAFMLGFEDLEPASIGFDTAIQMPPLRAPLPDLKKELKIGKPKIFKGEVRDYQGLQRCFNPIQISTSTWPAVCPSWDNTARKMERAHSLIHASPENYLTWLKEVVSFLRKDRPLGERIVFINAWNEWGEGCHLEPDNKFGYGYLNATRTALKQDDSRNKVDSPELSLGMSLIMGSEQKTAGQKPSNVDNNKLIAFYLPQYHRIPENDDWWGPGFTEWTNVARGRPNFDGHYQPHIPRELGFYDLSYPDVIQRQTEMARLYGISGFCFYHYWFSGRKLLERPLDLFLRSETDMSFCICWANENWTRTWDGDVKSVLLEQKYSPGEEALFFHSIVDVLRDRRYIRVDGKPLLIVYRAKSIANPQQTFATWRRMAYEAGLGGLHISVVDFYDISNPAEVDADSLLEFPPHKFNRSPNVPNSVPPITNPSFSGSILDYRKMIAQSLDKVAPSFTYFRGIVPNWDNTARRQDSPTTIIHSTPEWYGKWLTYLRAYTRRHAKQPNDALIFVNAWNEWGEGCHLEPDVKWGLQYLESTFRTGFLDPAASLEETTAALHLDLLHALGCTENGIAAAKPTNRMYEQADPSHGNCTQEISGGV
jgi:lipopolysaccharide biosynthesis protein